jgi:MerR family transcriptional regulator, heat shock protein HspR
MTTSRAVYVISVAAEIAGVHPQTLRNYERAGLLDPERTKGKTRRFSDADLLRLARITELTTAGVSLEGVRRILALEAEIEELRRSAVPAPRLPSTALVTTGSRTMVVRVARTR